MLWANCLARVSGRLARSTYNYNGSLLCSVCAYMETSDFKPQHTSTTQQHTQRTHQNLPKTTRAHQHHTSTTPAPHCLGHSLTPIHHTSITSARHPQHTNTRTKTTPKPQKHTNTTPAHTKTTPKPPQSHTSTPAPHESHTSATPAPRLSAASNTFRPPCKHHTSPNHSSTIPAHAHQDQTKPARNAQNVAFRDAFCSPPLPNASVLRGLLLPLGRSCLRSSWMRWAVCGLRGRPAVPLAGPAQRLPAL